MPTCAKDEAIVCRAADDTPNRPGNDDDDETNPNRPGLGDNEDETDSTERTPE